MTDTNKRLLISESRGDLNRCTPCRGKPDQHATYDSHASPRTLPVGSPRTWQPFMSYRQSWADPLLPKRRASSFSPEPANEAVGAKSSIYQRSTTRLTELISPVCNRYIQYLLTGANPSVLNRHRRGLQPWRCWLFTYHSPTFSTSCLPFPPKSSVRSLV
jgi:hypothetical protein